MERGRPTSKIGVEKRKREREKTEKIERGKETYKRETEILTFEQFHKRTDCVSLCVYKRI